MFNVFAQRDVKVLGFDTNFDAGSVTVEVYTVAGGYQGHETSPAAWTLIGSAAITSNGPNVATPLPFALDVDIAAGETMGFYITGAIGAGINYTNGAGTGVDAAANADISINEGLGVLHPFGTSYSPRIWNGTIYYTSETGTRYCFGDGSDGVCPCGNFGPSEAGCGHSGGLGGKLAGDGSSSLAADTLNFTASDLPPNRPSLLLAGSLRVGTGGGTNFGDGFLCSTGATVKFGVRFSDINGSATWGPGMLGQGMLQAGTTQYFQVIYRDSSLFSPCGTQFNSTNGVELGMNP